MSEFQSFTYEMTIKEHHLDTFGHVNNATYLQILEQARWELLTINGFGLETIQRLKQGPVVLECKIKFSRELMLREKIRIESQVISYEEKIGIMRQDIFNGRHQLAAQAQFTFGFFDMNQRKLVLPSVEWLTAIGQF